MPLLQARGLGLEIGGACVLQDLNFALYPGLNLIRGGEGRGKTSLLKLIAAQIKPSFGFLGLGGKGASFSPEIFYTCPEAETHDPCVAEAWLAHQAAGFSGWQASRLPALVEALALGEHLSKPMFMLSTGSRRKMGLLAAVASGAELTLLDQPFVALDGRSVRVLTEILLEAATQGNRAWVLADYQLPPALHSAVLQSLIDLGD